MSYLRNVHPPEVQNAPKVVENMTSLDLQKYSNFLTVCEKITVIDPKGDLIQMPNLFYIDMGVPWDVWAGSETLPQASGKIRCRAYYHFKVQMATA